MRKESQSQRAWRGQGSHWRVEEGSGAEGEEKGGSRKVGENLSKHINRWKTHWSFAVSLPDSHIHCSPHPFSSPPALISTRLLQPSIHLEPWVKSVSSFYITRSFCNYKQWHTYTWKIALMNLHKKKGFYFLNMFIKGEQMWRGIVEFGCWVYIMQLHWYPSSQNFA